MDMRGHGKSEGFSAYFESISTLHVDFKDYLTKVVEELYSKKQGFDETPPIFLAAHGLGALITMKFLVLNDKYKHLTCKIKGIGFFNPFFHQRFIPQR